jgi:hypothetical protein
MSFLRRLFKGGGAPSPPARGPHARFIRQCEDAANDILAFLEGRARKEPSPEPSTRNNDAWHDAQNNHARYMMDTMGEYRARFDAQVGRLRDGLAQREIVDVEFDRLVEHAGNPAGARRLAEMLVTLSRRLDPEIAALEQVFASDRTADVE